MYIRANGTRYFTASFGSGTPIFLAHPTWLGNWELWLPTLEPLSHDWRVAAYDIRGTGETALGVEEVTLERLVDDLVLVMDRLEIERCVLGSESAGSILSLQAALTHPERFDGLVVISGLPAFPRARSEPFLNSLQADFDGTVDAFVARCLPEPDVPEIHRWLNRIFHRSQVQDAVTLARAMWDVDLRTTLPRLEMPVLLIHGSQDSVSTLANSETMAALIPNNRLVVLDGIGHAPTLTAPAAVAEAVNDFFGVGDSVRGGSLAR